MPSTQSVCSFPQPRASSVGAGSPSPPCAQPWDRCCHPLCSADTHLVLCFHILCLFGHICHLQTRFLLVPFGILFIWVCTHTSVHTSVLFPCIFTWDSMFVFHLGLFPSCCTEKLQRSQFLLAHRSSYDYICASLEITADTSISDHNFCGQPASHSLAGKEKEGFFTKFKTLSSCTHLGRRCWALRQVSLMLGLKSHSVKLKVANIFLGMLGSGSYKVLKINSRSSAHIVKWCS